MWPDKFVYATYEDRILFGYDVRLFWNCDPKIKNQAAAFRRKLLDNYFQSKGNVAILYWDRFIYKPILIAFFRKNTAKARLNSREKIPARALARAGQLTGRPARFL